METDGREDKDKDGERGAALEAPSLCAVMEAVLFMSDRPLPLERIRALLGPDVPPGACEEALGRLREAYAGELHGVELREVAGGWQFRTKESCAKAVPDALKGNAFMLSSAALEVLAVVAYRQPVPKADIDGTRGVDSAAILRGLLAKRLVRTVGKSSDPGRPTLYGTTREFLELFGLPGLGDLPPERELEELADEGVGSPSDVASLAAGGGGALETAGDVEEMDGLERRIRSVPSGTDFTKSLARSRARGRAADGSDGADGAEGEAAGAGGPDGGGAFALLERHALAARAKEGDSPEGSREEDRKDADAEP